MLIHLIIGFYLLLTKSANGFRQWGAFQHVSQWASRYTVVCSRCSQTSSQSLRIGHLDPKLGQSIGSRKNGGTRKGGLLEFLTIWSESKWDCDCLMGVWDLCVWLVLQSVLASCLLWLIRLRQSFLDAQKIIRAKCFPASSSLSCVTLRHCCIGNKTPSPYFTLYPLPFPSLRCYWLLTAGGSRDLVRQPHILS